MSLHIELAAIIDATFSSDLETPAECTQDALIVRLANGVALTVHYAATDAYSLRWISDGRIAGIDTAPLHRDLSTFPNHLHCSNGEIISDPVTSPEARPEVNLTKLVHLLIHNPQLGMAKAG